MTMSVRHSLIEPEARGWRGPGRVGRLALSLALAAVVGIVAARPGSAQSAVSLPEMDTHRIHGLRVDAPSPLREHPEAGPDAYSIRTTDVSGHRALVGSNRVPVSDGGAVLRAQVTRAGREVWVVMVFGREGPRLGSFSDAVLGSAAIEGS